VIATSLARPALRLVLKVGENVNNTHDLHDKTFAHKGHMPLGFTARARTPL